MVVLILFFNMPLSAAAESAAYYFKTSVTRDSVEVKFFSCDETIVPLFVISNTDQIAFGSGVEIGPCQSYKASGSFDARLEGILFTQTDKLGIITMLPESKSDYELSSEVKSVLIFVGGLVAAMIGRIFALVLDPIYYSFKLILKYRATKSFFTSVSDSFDKDFAVSEDLRGVARGEFLTNFLLTTNLRKKIKDLVSYIDDWKVNELTPKEFRSRLEKL